MNELRGSVKFPDPGIRKVVVKPSPFDGSAEISIQDDIEVYASITLTDAEVNELVIKLMKRGSYASL